METEPSPSQQSIAKETDSTVIILLGILLPSTLICLLILCFCLKRFGGRKKMDEIWSRDKQTELTRVRHSGCKPEKIAHGVTQSDLKFVVPQYSTYQWEMDEKRSWSPKLTSKDCRHYHSAPTSPVPLEVSEEIPKGDFQWQYSTPERPPSASTAEDVHGICVQMYTSESDGDSAADCEDRLASSGKLCFSVEVNLNENQILVHLKQALRLRSKSMKGSINPCIRVSIHPDSKKTKFYTRLHHSANPDLKETFSFPLQQILNSSGKRESETSDHKSIHASSLNDLEIRLTLFHCDLFSRRSEVGHIAFQPFESRHQEIDTSHSIFQSGGIEVWRDFKNVDEKEGETERESKGQILIALCRDPDKKTLSVGILKGKDISFHHGGTGSESSFIFAKMSLIQGGKVRKSKRTTTKKKTQNPVFNETFRFYVKNSLLDKISINVSLCSKNVLGSSKVIGRITVGPVMYAFGSGLEHWNDMITVPKSGVAQWHHIY